MAVQYDEVEHKLQSLPHPSATADMLWQEQQEDIKFSSAFLSVSKPSIFGSAFLSYFSWDSKIALFFNFPVSRARPEKLCDFYWMQLRITRKSGWIAQAEKSMLHPQETATVRPFSSLRSKRFQSCYCAKVRAGAKKESASKGEGEGERGEEETAFPSFPSPSPVNHFFPLLSQFSRRTRAETLTTQASLFNNPTLVPWYLIGLLPLKQDIPINCHQKYHLGLLND